ncbi:putative LOB domain-containing protein [Quillaja saponaria]|uniref:LOB domain-containing protein n=1 Tax=Quillaja saponaria TaxID=32244 RepID=A0AAD7PHZ5_QUISA|nr:putative LOB domain-containing protein [Quillaja saponaria]
MTLKGGTSQACAACKYQRRKCTSECHLAPYFPADQPNTFRNVHKLFGVSNILKILKNLEPNQKREAMRSIIYQAYIRDRYPVLGCCEVINQLRNQIWQVAEELHAVYAQLEMYRQQNQNPGSYMPDDETSQLELGMATCSNNAGLSFFNQTPQNFNMVAAAALPISQQHSYSNSSNVASNSLYMDSKDNNTNPLWFQHPNTTTNNNNLMATATQSRLVDSQPIAIQEEVVEDYDEMHTFFNTIDDRQSYIDSKEAYDSSSEESLKDTRQCIERVAENELKTAAACFSLTSVN